MSINWNFELTNVALLIGAVVAAIYAHRQVAAMRESNQKQANSAKNQELQLRASVLLSLDERWESETMTSAVAELQSLIKEVENALIRANPDVSLVDLRRRSAPIYLAKLREMETHEPRRYLLVFRICSFFETLGYTAKARYLTVDDVFELFSVSITATAMVFRPYIEEMVRQEAANPMLYANFRWLIGEIEKRASFSGLSA